MDEIAKALQTLRESSLRFNSDRLVVSVDNEIIINETSGRVSEPIELMSVTKSIVCLAIGLLIQQKKIDSLEIRLSDYFPEWRTRDNDSITLLHVLNHTSGLHAQRTTEELYKSDDFLKVALDAPIAYTPGSHFFYNNKATQLLSGVVQRASGLRLDHFLKRFLFDPLEISNWSWSLDKAGNPHGFAGLKLYAEDLHKIGRVLLENFADQDTEFFPRGWVKRMFEQGQPHDPTCGLLWWREGANKQFFYEDSLIAAYNDAGMPSDQSSTLKQFSVPMPIAEFRSQLVSALGSAAAYNTFITFANNQMLPTKRLCMDPAAAFLAKGYLGQFLVLVPETNIIAVRQLDSDSVTEAAVNEYEEFPRQVLKLHTALLEAGRSHRPNL